MVQKAADDRLTVKANTGTNLSTNYSFGEADFQNDWRLFTGASGKHDSLLLSKNNSKKEPRLRELIDEKLMLTSRMQSEIERANDAQFSKMKQIIMTESERPSQNFPGSLQIFESLVGLKNGSHQYVSEVKHEAETGRQGLPPISPIRFQVDPASSLMNTIVGNFERPAASLLGSIAPGHYGDIDMSMERGYSELSFDNIGKSKNPSFFQPLRLEDSEDSRRKGLEDKKKLQVSEPADRR